MVSAASNTAPFFMRALHADANALRAGCLFLALVIYAFLGSPTPDNPGMPELLIGALLIMAAGLPAGVGALNVNLRAPLWEGAGQILLLFGLGAGLSMAALHGHDVRLVIRDIIPFGFLLLPLFLMPLCREYPSTFKYLVAGMCVIGAAFSLRAMGDVGASLVALFVPSAQGELMYLANAPTLLFSALLFCGVGLTGYMRDFTPGAALRGAALCILAAVVLIPVALTTQRASLGYALFYGAVIMAGLFVKYPQRTAGALLLVGLALLPFYDVAATLLASLAQKTSLVGFNARFEELGAVWGQISQSSVTTFFGLGWGGTFESPAVGEIRVNFTHSLLSSMLLKLGIGGVILVFLYLFGLFLALLRAARLNPVLALALAGPVAIDVFLYASFKSLDFGLVLLAIPAFLVFHEARRGQA